MCECVSEKSARLPLSQQLFRLLCFVYEVETQSNDGRSRGERETDNQKPN